MLRAAQVVLEEGLAHPILIGRPHVIDVRLKRYGLQDQAGHAISTLINPEDDPRYRDYVDLLIELAGRRGVTQEAARTTVRTDTTVIAALALKRGDADAMICGLEGRFERHLRNVNLIIGPRAGVRDRDLSALSMLIWQRGVIFFTDTYVTVDPSAEEIAEMTMLAAEEIRRFGIEPKAALLSHSNFGSRDSPSALKMREAAAILKRVAPELISDGEMHGDSALSEILRNRVYPHSNLKGEANLLVFPNLDAANIALTIAKTMLDALHVGPILLGTDKPAHILTPSVTSRGVVNMTALAVVEASHKAQARHADVTASMRKLAANLPYRKAKVNFAAVQSGARSIDGGDPAGGRDEANGNWAWLARHWPRRRCALRCLAARPSARARICRQLEAELASRAAAAARAQVQEIRPRRRRPARPAVDARSRARRAGCGFSLSGGRPAMCAPLNDPDRTTWSAISTRWSASASALSGGGGSTRDRARILAALDANDCRDKEVAEREPPRGATAPQSVRPAVRRRRQREGLRSKSPSGLPFERRSRSSDRGARLARGARRPGQRHAHPQPQRRDLGPRPGRRVRHHVRAHLRRLLFSDVAHLVVGSISTAT